LRIPEWAALQEAAAALQEAVVGAQQPEARPAFVAVGTARQP